MNQSLYEINHNLCRETGFKNRMIQSCWFTGEGASSSVAQCLSGTWVQSSSNGKNSDRVTNRLLLEDPGHGVCPEIQL